MAENMNFLDGGSFPLLFLIIILFLLGGKRF